MDVGLPQAMIEDGMARAEKVACAPGDGRCYTFPDPLDDALGDAGRANVLRRAIGQPPQRQKRPSRRSADDR